ncbi:hypothetical protein ACFYVR_13585 [Rhodococcus sp. NPDC003318]|uniref:hypothetical protein n=1 Tax=Rhodococcus sp. NPDC003318 TaxID=3364503 RepID=UPI003696E86D
MSTVHRTYRGRGRWFAAVVVGAVGTPYAFAFTVAGDPAPAVTTADALPAGITLSPAGVL